MPWTNASIVLNSRDATSGSYNALKFNAVNQNIIQGQIHSISVNEVNFPYDIPNIQAGYNTFELVAETPQGFGAKRLGAGSGPGSLVITVAPGFYSGTELATEITRLIGVEQVAVGSVAADAPTVTYDNTSNTFSFVAPTAPPPGNPTPTWAIFSPYTFPVGYNGNTNKLGKDILSIMGYYIAQAGPGTATLNRVSSDPAQAAFETFVSGSAPLVFTQYIDICSPLLCQYQYFRDGSTTNLARRADVICRLYISNNVATQEEEGSRPFVIQRQFNNARVMRWSAESAVGQLDISLFDDVGQPLTTTWLPRPYQITFNCYEQDKDSITY
jgi:hypothetical protein